MYRRRVAVLLFVIAAAFAAVELRLVCLQIVSGRHYADYADRQRIGLFPQDVARGRILTGDGAVLAEDSLAFDVAVVIGRLDPANERRLRGPLRELFYVGRTERLIRAGNVRWEIRADSSGSGEPRLMVRGSARLEVESADEGGRLDVHVVERSTKEFPLPEHLVNAAGKLARISGLPSGELLDRVLGAAVEVAKLRVPVLAPVPVIKGVDYDVVAAIETRADEFRGFEITTRFERAMPAGPVAPHVVGYVSGFDRDDVEAAMRKYNGWPGAAYFMDQRIGRAGIEHCMDHVLRGEFGVECVERDSMNRRQNILADAPPTPGRDVVLTIDLRLQKAVERAMRGRVGAAVFMDVRTGHILAIASMPAYDPVRLRLDYGGLAANPDKPLFDRAVSAALPLGSVFKVATALAAIEQDSVPVSVNCTGSIEYGGRTFRCNSRHGHGVVELTDAMKVSCNVFFYAAAQRVGGGPLIDMARRLGLGSLTRVGIPQESPGSLPVSANGGELLNLGIGQGQLVVTPLQVARMMAAVANGGVLVPVQIVRELRPFDTDGGPAAEAVADERKPVRLGISERALEAVRMGLYKVVNEAGGTGFRAFEGFNRPFKVCGKTSTAQRNAMRNGRVVTDNVGWFAGYAPHDVPRVAFVVVVERLSGSEGGGGTAAPIARKILEALPLDLLGIEGPKQDAQK